METYIDKDFEEAYRTVSLQVGYSSKGPSLKDGIETGRTYSETLDSLIEADK